MNNTRALWWSLPSLKSEHLAKCGACLLSLPPQVRTASWRSTSACRSPAWTARPVAMPRAPSPAPALRASRATSASTTWTSAPACPAGTGGAATTEPQGESGAGPGLSRVPPAPTGAVPVRPGARRRRARSGSAASAQQLLPLNHPQPSG